MLGGELPLDPLTALARDGSRRLTQAELAEVITQTGSRKSQTYLSAIQPAEPLMRRRQGVVVVGATVVAGATVVDGDSSGSRIGMTSESLQVISAE